MSEISLIGKKIGMTREFYKTGRSTPVTVIKMEKARVINVIEENKRGYKAVQLLELLLPFPSLQRSREQIDLIYKIP